MLESYLGEHVSVTIDRPLGSTHPEHNTVYPVNYGYIDGTVAGDGEEVDAYVLGVYEPVERYDGVVIAVIRREDDVEDKLVVADRMGRYTKKQIESLVEFQERFFRSEVIMLPGESEEQEMESKQRAANVSMSCLAVLLLVEIVLKKEHYDLLFIIWVQLIMEAYYEYRESKGKSRWHKWKLVIVSVMGGGCPHHADRLFYKIGSI